MERERQRERGRIKQSERETEKEMGRWVGGVEAVAYGATLP